MVFNNYAVETATFVADAVNYDSIEWIFIAPNGNEYTQINGVEGSVPYSAVVAPSTYVVTISNSGDTAAVTVTAGSTGG